MEQENKIPNTHEEINQLKSRIAELEKTYEGSEKPSTPEIIKEAIVEHAEKEPKEVLAKEYLLPQEEAKQHASSIVNIQDDDEEEETHKKNQIAELLQIAEEKGILNSISVAQNMGEHFVDDLYAVLVKRFQEEIDA